jgi:hypothetical protein
VGVIYFGLAYPGYWGIFLGGCCFGAGTAAVVVACFVHLSPSYFLWKFIYLFLIPLDG